MADRTQPQSAQTPSGTRGLDVVAGGAGLRQAHPDAQLNSHADARPFLMVTFSCPGAYQRVYRSRDASHYLARCPKCGRSVRFLVGEGGTASRSFHVHCG